MKRGSEIGLETIKTVNREGTDDLKELHYAINDLMFDYNRKYISRNDAKSILGQLAEFGEALKELTVPEKAKAKRNEILTAVRNAWIAVNKYYKEFHWKEEDVKQIQATINYEVKMLVDAKADGKLQKFPMKYLEQTKRIYDNMVEDSGYKEELKLKTFVEFNNQLLAIIDKTYRIDYSI